LNNNSGSYEVTIGGRKIGPGHSPFIVAEMSGNHNRSLERALQIIEKAKKAGADAVKFQTYTADTMTLDLKTDEFFLSDMDNPWEGKSLYEIYKEACTPWEWHETLVKKCQELGIIWFSSPFDDSAVDFLENLNAPAYKIASAENTDIQLIRKAASTGKPVIISTGMATVADLAESVEAARSAGCKELILLKCTCTYPAPSEHSNLLTIPHLKDLFNVPVGLSDHTLGIGTGIASVALGAVLVEKHFTLSRDDGGVDAFFSLDPEEFQMLCQESRRAWESLGKIAYGPVGKEKDYLKCRRSLYVVKDMKEGEPFTAKNVRGIRPGLGLPIKYFDVFKGAKSSKNVERGTPLSWDLIRKSKA
jgi:pseudaminic acid synthase